MQSDGFILTVYPLSPPHSTIHEQHTQARKIIENHGRTSLARFALLPDKSLFFSLFGSVIAYVRKGRTALTLGDPIGTKDNTASSIEAFKDFCAQNQWQACFYQIQPNHLDIYADHGFDIMRSGQEAIIDLTTFNLAGSAGGKLRNAVCRMNRLGYHVKVHESPLSDELLGRLDAVSNEWLTRRLGREVRFSVGWFDKEYVRHSTVAAVYSPEGCITAFANIVSEGQIDRVALDLMRHCHKVESRTMDFLFVSFLEWAKQRGHSTFSLGFCPLSGIGENSQDPFIEKALHVLYENIKGYPNLKGLHAFKDKFHPRWELRYMAYPSFAHLPAIGMALARAHFGD